MAFGRFRSPIIYRQGSELNKPRLSRPAFKSVAAMSGIQPPGPHCYLAIWLSMPPRSPGARRGCRGRCPLRPDTNLGGTLNSGGRPLAVPRAVYLHQPDLSLPPCARSSGHHCLRSEIAGSGCPVSEHGRRDFPVAGPRTLWRHHLRLRNHGPEYAAQWGFPVLIDRCGVLAGPRQMGRVDQE